MTFTKCQNKIYARGDETEMIRETGILGIVIMGILGIVFQYLDSSVILTVHILWLIWELL